MTDPFTWDTFLKAIAMIGVGGAWLYQHAPIGKCKLLPSVLE